MVEQLCKQIVRVVRSLLTEWRLNASRRPSIVDCIQWVISQSTSKRLESANTDTNPKRKCSMEAFAGLKPKRFMIWPTLAKKFNDYSTIDKKKTRETVQVDEIHRALQEMHKKVSDNNRKDRTKAQRIHSAMTRVVPISFHVGDYVKIHPACSRHNKLNADWIGPMHIVDTKLDSVFGVENLRRIRKKIVHTQQILPYLAQQSPNLASKKLLKYAQNLDSSVQLINELPNVRLNNSEHEICVSWEGWNGIDDRTWEPLPQFKEHELGLVKNNLHSPGRQSIKLRILNDYY